MAKIIKMKDLLNEGKEKFGTIYNMKDEMKSGKFDPKNPSINIQGFGVWKLKTLEKSIARD